MRTLGRGQDILRACIINRDARLARLPPLLTLWGESRIWPAFAWAEDERSHLETMLCLMAGRLGDAGASKDKRQGSHVFLLQTVDGHVLHEPAGRG